MTVENETPDSVDTAATEKTGTEGLENQEQQEGQAAQQEGGEGQEGEQPKKTEPQKKSRAQERVEQAVKRANEAERKLAEYEAKQNSQAKQSELKRPDFEDFEDFAEFQKAESQYFIDVAKAEMRAEMQQQQASQAATAQEAEFQTAMDELSDEGVDVDAYFKKAETLPELPVTLDQFGLTPIETLRLAKDLLDDEATYLAISQMKPVQAAVKIGQIIEGRKTKTAPPVSQAPKPIKPVQANAPAARDPSKMSDSEWLEWRKTQVKSKK